MQGFVPLWEQGHQLFWSFDSSFDRLFVNPEAAKNKFAELFDRALSLWQFNHIQVVYSPAGSDFRIVQKPSDECTASGCVLASAFFPDGGRHELNLFPILWRHGDDDDIVNTLVHEIGHIWGLRHWFALSKEPNAASFPFRHDPNNLQSIMNYGENSILTEKDKTDLREFYQYVWENRSLPGHSDKQVRLFRPFH